MCGPHRQPGQAAILTAIAVLCLIWGTTWLVIQEGLLDLPPFTAAAVRMVIAGAVLAAIARPLHRIEGGARPTLALSVLLGGLNFGTSYGIVYWGQTVIPSGLASILWAIFPMMVAGMGHLLLPAERLSLAQASGFAVAFAGIVTLFVGDLRGIGPRAIGFGAMFLASPLVSALGQTLVKRHGSATSATLLTRNGMLIGAGLLSVAMLLVENPGAVEWTPRAILSILYLAVPGTVVTFVLYYWLLRHQKSSRLSLIAYVTPCIAVTLGAARGERVLWTTLGGAALVFAGIAIVRRR